MNKQTKYLGDKKKQENENITHLYLSYPQLARSLLLCYSIAIMLLILVLFLWIKTVIKNLVIFAFK